MPKNKLGEIQKIGVDAEALEVFRDKAEAGTREKRSANNLKIIRSNSGKTQKQVAEELGISLSAYRTYEQGTRRLTDELLLQLSTYFSVSVDSILGSKFSTSLSSPSFLEDSEMRSIVNAAVSEMNKEDRQQFRKLLESYMALSSTGRKQLADSADTMNRSGKYKRFGNIAKSNTPACSHGRAKTA